MSRINLASLVSFLALIGSPAAAQTDLAILTDLDRDGYALAVPIVTNLDGSSGYGSTAYALRYNRETGRLDEYRGNFTITCITPMAEANHFYPDRYRKVEAGGERPMTSAEIQTYFPAWVAPRIRASACERREYFRHPEHNDVDSFRSWYASITAR